MEKTIFELAFYLHLQNVAASGGHFTSPLAVWMENNWNDIYLETDDQYDDYLGT